MTKREEAPHRRRPTRAGKVARTRKRRLPVPPPLALAKGGEHPVTDDDEDDDTVKPARTTSGGGPTGRRLGRGCGGRAKPSPTS